MNIVSDQAFGTFYPYLGALVAERVVGGGHPLRDAPDLAEELQLCGGETDAPSVDKMAGMPKVQQYSLRTLMILAESSFGSLKTESQLEYLSHKAR